MEKIYYYVVSKVDSDGKAIVCKAMSHMLHSSSVTTFPDGYLIMTRVSKKVFNSLPFDRIGINF